MKNPIVQKVTFVLAVLFVVDLAFTLLLGWRYPAKVRVIRQKAEIAAPPSITGRPKIVEPGESGRDLGRREEILPYDESPVPLNEVEYEYPPLAKEAGIEGTVWVKVLVDTKGNVSDAIVFKESGSNVGFEEAAIESAFEVKYKPAIRNNQPVAVWIVYPARFSLK